MRIHTQRGSVILYIHVSGTGIDMSWIDGLTRSEAAHRLESLRSDTTDSTSRLLTQFEHRQMVLTYEEKFGKLSEDGKKHFENKYDSLRLQIEQEQIDEQSRLDGEAAMKKFQKEKAEKKRELDERLQRDKVKRSQERDDRYRRIKSKRLQDLVNLKGRIQRLGNLIYEYSGQELDTLVSVSTTPILREESESDTGYRKRWVLAQDYEEGKQERSDRLAEIGRKITGKSGKLPEGEELETLLVEFEQLGGNADGYRKQKADRERRAKETYDRFEQIRQDAEEAIMTQWRNPSPKIFRKRWVLSGSKYTFSPLGYNGKMIVRILSNGSGFIKVIGDVSGVIVAGMQMFMLGYIQGKNWRGKTLYTAQLTSSQGQIFLDWIE